MPSLKQIDECLNSGGHYWVDVPAGENHQCERCGHLGALNVPEVNERPFDATS